jgi:hypothetical protein
VRSGIECNDSMMLFLGNWSHINTQTDHTESPRTPEITGGDLQSRTGITMVQNRQQSRTATSPTVVV